MNGSDLRLGFFDKIAEEYLYIQSEIKPAANIFQSRAMSLSNPRPKRVLIVGAGPSGLVTLRNLNERGKFDHVELVERRDDVGGVW